MRLKKLNLGLFAILIIIIVFMLVMTVMGYINRDKFANVDNIQRNTDAVFDTFTLKIDDIDLVSNKEISGLIYFGRETCDDCLTFNQVLKLFYEENPDLTIYKFDTDYWRDNEKFTSVLESYGIESVPTLIYLSDAGIVQAIAVDGRTPEEVYQEITQLSSPTSDIAGQLQEEVTTLA